MKKEEYLNTVVNQIRCKQARTMVEDEIKAHIEDQANVYITMGIEKEMAEQEAVKEMGDPVDTGVKLDRIHRPRMAFKVLALIAFISVLSIVIQFLFYKDVTTSDYYFKRHLLYTITGFAFMLLVNFVDYSRIGVYAKPIAIALLSLFIIVIFFVGTDVNGVKEYLVWGPMAISVKMLLYLYPPLYGAILYQYRGEGYKALFKAAVWMAIPLCTSLSIPSLVFNLFLILMMLLIVVILRCWFAINKRLVLSAIFAVLALFPIILSNMVAWNDYQLQRIRMFFQFFTLDTEGIGYQISTVRQIMRESTFFTSKHILQINGDLSYANSDYLLTTIIAYYGILAALFVVFLLFVLIRSMVKISLKQRNQLGMIMGLSCGLVFTIQVVTFVLQNIGLYPTTFVFLPLLSYGATGNYVAYMLLGILLSIYRYQTILPSQVGKKRKVKLFIIRE